MLLLFFTFLQLEVVCVLLGQRLLHRVAFVRRAVVPVALLARLLLLFFTFLQLLLHLLADRVRVLLPLLERRRLRLSGEAVVLLEPESATLALRELRFVVALQRLVSRGHALLRRRAVRDGVREAQRVLAGLGEEDRVVAVEAA